MKFDHTTKRCLRKLESVLVNDTRKILWDFEKQTDYQIPTRRLDQEIINKKRKKKEKKICCIVDLAIPANYKMRIKESEKEKSTRTLPVN